MNILIAVSHAGFLRNFESTLALLAEHGHRLHIVTDRRKVADVLDGAPIIDRLTARFPAAFTFESVQFSKKQSWYAFAILVRAALDYWRYLSPAFADAPKLRARGRDNAPAPVVWLAELPLLRSRAGLGLLTRCFRRLESVIPVRREVEELFDRYPPDVLFVTPLLYFGSQQVDYVRCARRRGINSVLGVGSWDHLTTKGAIHEMPDRLLVWNDLQRREAVDLHGAPPEHVVVTGAQAYDHWFASSPSTAREEFCARVGVPAARPYLLYLCSSPFIAPYEVGFVRRWIEAVRASHDRTLREVGIVVRPHPQNAAQWADVDLSALADVSIWPRAGANPTRLAARHEYYDSMYHSHAVVGVNTSALIESGIVGRLVYSITVPEFSGTQEGTLHFQHLKRGGLLTLADTLDVHVAQLAQSFASAEEDRLQVRAFIQAFVRPHGLTVAATPRVVSAVEALAGQAPAPRPLPRLLRPLQLTLHVVLTLLAVPLSALMFADRERWQSQARKRAWQLRKGSWRLRKRAVSVWRAWIWGVRKRMGMIPKRAWSAWRHVLRPIRMAFRWLRSVFFAAASAVSRAARASRMIASGGGRWLVKSGRRTAQRMRARMGAVARRIWSSDRIA
jgi:hypothetical protein